MKKEMNADKENYQGDSEAVSKYVKYKPKDIGKFRDIFLVLFGAMVSIVATIYVSFGIYKGLILFFIFLALAVIFIVLAFLDSTIDFCRKHNRAKNAKKGKYIIGIIRAGKSFEINSEKWRAQKEDPPKWSGITVKEWKDLLTYEFHDSTIEYVDPMEDFTRFNCVVNPFGGMYYEESFTDQKSLRKILRYTSKGGIYVNVSDIPFFYAYNIETDMWLYNSPAFSVLPHSSSTANISTTGLYPGSDVTSGTIPVSPISQSNLSSTIETYVDYNYYIFKDLGITFLMPVGGGEYINLAKKIDITYKPKESCEPMKIGNIMTEDTRPFLIPKTFSGSSNITASNDDNENLSALNWLNQEQKITPVAVLPNGRGELIISTVSLDKFPNMAKIIIRMVEDALSESSGK